MRDLSRKQKIILRNKVINIYDSIGAVLLLFNVFTIFPLLIMISRHFTYALAIIIIADMCLGLIGTYMMKDADNTRKRLGIEYY